MDLHRHPGHPAGHLPDVRRRGPEALRRRPGRQARADGRPRRHGRRAAARRHHGRRRRALRRGRPAPHRAAPRDRATSTSPPTRWTRRSGWPTRPMAAQQAALHRPARQRRRRLSRAGPPRRHPRPRHRPDLGARHAQRLRAQRHDARGGARAAARRPGRVRAPRRRQHRRPRARPWSRCRRPAPTPSTTATTSAARRRRPATPTPSPSPASCRPTSGRCSARGNGPFRWAALSGDPQDIAVTDAALLEAFPDNEMVTRWIRMAGEKVQFQGLPCRICWLEYGERAKAGAIFNDLVRTGKVKAPHRHRPRPPRLRLGREPVSRDREHAGRQRRHRRLADPQRAAQHGGGRELGELPPRRRRGHRQEPARRHGRGRRRHRHDGRAPAPRAHHRPRHRRHAPRGRRVSGGHREGQGVGHRPPDGGQTDGGDR